jgi:hypothetical protein
MRAGLVVRVVGGTSAFVVALGLGCGGSSTAPDADSGPDVVTSSDAIATETSHVSVPESGGMEASPPEASAEASSDASAEADAEPFYCLIDADISHLQLPDASLGDAGANVAGCYACVQNSCATQVSACAGDCACKENVVSFVECIGLGGAIASCLTKLSGTDPATLGFTACLLTSGCMSACGV